MRCARSLLAGLLALLLGGCGGGNSTETTITGGGLSGGSGATVAQVDTPSGTNTTEIVVDTGPEAAFSLGAVNIPYVTVTVCTPGVATQCVSIPHVFLDTGSIGLRVMRSAVASLGLPAVQVPADAAHATVAGTAVECYPFVLGAVWGALAQADVQIGGESAAGIPIQLIDDLTPPANAAPPDCLAAAQPGELMNSVPALQANGILGIGMLGYDCGLGCALGNYAGTHVQYYSCNGATCSAAALPSSLQAQNPVVHFALDNNGTVIVMPALPELGAGIARGRLVFGIGTQANNQIPPTATMYFVNVDPASPSYLSLATTMGSTRYPDSYIDSGSNALFFDDATLPRTCQSSSGLKGGWYCPSNVQHYQATLTDAYGSSGTVAFSLANADALFSTSGTAFDDLAGSTGQSASAFVWGMSFFYGRSVFTSIWGQPLSAGGPWNAF